MDRTKQAELAVNALAEAYPDAVCSLEYQKPYELLFATRLAAQCTDARVNIVTKELYARYSSLESIAAADITELENIVRPCGLGPSKARDIIKSANMLLDIYGGVVPDTMDELLKLPGVGRKTANLILGDVYHKPAVVCDTHCIRITNRLGLAKGENALVIERQLREVLPPEDSNDFCHRLVLHGRAVCQARKPLCGQCNMNGFCDMVIL